MLFVTSQPKTVPRESVTKYHWVKGACICLMRSVTNTIYEVSGTARFTALLSLIFRKIW